MPARGGSHFIQPFTDARTLVERGPRLICRGEGIYIEDSEGQRFLDAMSGHGAVSLGYGRRDLIDAATRQLEDLAYYPSQLDTSVPPAVGLAALLAEVTPESFEHFFFVSSGSDATDSVFRLVRRYWDLAQRPDKKIIISARNAYHGSTVFAAALGITEDERRAHGLPVSGTEVVAGPDWELYGQDMPPAVFGLRAALWLEAKIVALGSDNVAAFIGEPVQGAAGFVVPPSTYWPEVQRVCEKHDVLLVSDEVTCGFGRLGAWFGFEHFGFRPDLFTFGKGVTSGYVPLGGVAVGERVARPLLERGGVFEHGFSGSGHPVACAVAIATIRALQREEIIPRLAADTAPHLRRRFMELRDHPLVGSAQTCGMTGSLGIVRRKDPCERFDPERHAARLCRDRCIDAGVIVWAVGDRINIAPPLVIDHAGIDRMVGLIREGLDRAARELPAPDFP